jgi:threonine aldolase
VFGDDPSVNALQDKIAGAARLRGRAVRADRHAEQPVRHPVALPARRRIHRRPDAALLPLGRRRRGGVRQRAAAAAGPPADGTLALADIEAAIKPDDPHFARTRLLALENTLGGKVLPFAYLQQATALARDKGLAPTSMARACSMPPWRRPRERRRRAREARRIAGLFDSVSVCFSKGLGAPVGSACAARGLIARARRIRKMAGGGHAPVRHAGGRRERMRWTTTSSGWRRTTRWPRGWPRAWPASKACRSRRRRPTSCSSTWWARRASAPPA